MIPRDIVRARVATQLAATRPDPATVVREYGAVQAQDYRAALWAIALRTADATEADVERAISERAIVRTWPMRGTLHFVAPEDARWMLRLLAPRVITRAAARYRELGLDDRELAKARTILEPALAADELTRPEIFALLERHGIATADQRGVHVLSRLSMEGVLCVGAHRAKQPTFALLDRVAPRSRDLAGDEALGEIAHRYFTAHGPASDADLAWWTGLPLGIARRALEIARPRLVAHGDLYSGPASAAPSPRVHALPAFDEYTVGYKDRSAFLDPAHAVRTRNGIMSPVVVVDGQVAGTWSRTTKKDRVAIGVELFAPVSTSLRRELERAFQRYAGFLTAELDLSIVEADAPAARR